MGELKKLKAEETAKVEGANRSLDKSLSNTTYKSIDTEDRHHPDPQKTGE